MKSRLLVVSVCLAVLSYPVAWANDLPQAVSTTREMVVTANPQATAAGEQILNNGGTAADAMIAVQTVLGLVEPQSSGIGGGAFIVYYDAETGTTTTIDARETAPAAAESDLFLDENGDPLGFVEAWQSGLSAGVPGIPRMMEFMHERYGRLPRERLFVPAMTLAQRGFALTERTSEQVSGLLARNASCTERLFFRDPTAFNYFVDVDGETCSAKPAGTLIRNSGYADTMRLLAHDGADAFYSGAMAEDIVTAVRNDPNIPGEMTVQDLVNYRVVERPPGGLEYREPDVCGMGPPSSGGLAVGQILGVLENFTLAGDPLDVDVVHLFTQANRIAFADRNQYVGDSDFVTVPAEGMLDKDYLAQRVALIGSNDLGTVEPGTPRGVFDPNGPDMSAKDGGTSHVSIIDRYGNALSMTTTIESSFGNGVMVAGRGFLLNNELTDFSFSPTDDAGNPVANRVQPNKRPRSSMSPSIVFDQQGEVFLVTGSPGGARIIGYTAQSIINVLDFGMDPQEAINVPHYQNLNNGTALERPIPGVTLDYDADGLADALRGRLHNVGFPSLTSGLSLIQVTGDGFVGGADMRRDGAVGGR